VVHTYHDGTKHAFDRFARSLGYLDWASQPKPFRSFDGAPVFPLYPSPDAPAADVRSDAVPLGDVLRHALGLSAWKAFQRTRWSLRVNPSSGNLHPTECYVVAGAMTGLAAGAAVYHYAPDRHALEQRAALEDDEWTAFGPGESSCLVVLTSIHWRESWKYGERAFRYCQHDLGHAIAALRLACALVGWTARILPDWPHRDIRSLAGLDRDEDFFEAEREEPACVLLVGKRDAPQLNRDGLVAASRRARWFGRASQLSDGHVSWAIIDQIARATEDPGRVVPRASFDSTRALSSRPSDARAILLQRRSALAFDGQSSISRAGFFDMLARTLPDDHAPWDALWWTPRIHLALFVHRVDDLDPGLYVLPRDPAVLDRLQTGFAREFLWERADARIPLWCLVRGDARRLAQRLSCDQEIASDGFFSLGMIADFDRSLGEFGPPFYRHLFWESGVVGQVLYLEAEAAGARATGIGCFYDDPVHDTLGLSGHDFQSLYHFTVGMPVVDSRLTTEPGYAWESGGAP
jgi:SagB-type dehydrogenase family enzyme